MHLLDKYSKIIQNACYVHQEEKYKLVVPKIRFADPLGICESSAIVYKNTMTACYKPEVNAVSHIYITLENLFMSCNGIKP